MTYEEARVYIDESNQYGSKLGLAAVTELLRRLGNPQDKLKVIHVAGTNGKGSTTAFLTSILASAGFRVGRYISPAVFTYCERVQITKLTEGDITTEYITEQGVSDAIQIIKKIGEEMLRDGLDHPTAFEIETAMAILYLVKLQVDFAVIEVGLGGRLDATNIFHKPLCCVITSISRDHMEYLGDTLEKIAAEKAGIIKKGSRVITGNTQPQVYQVLADTCKSQISTLTLAVIEDVTNINSSPEGTTFTYQAQQYVITLLGDFQISNALLAIQTINQLRSAGYEISDASIKSGLLQTKWSGRFEVLAKEPYFIIDGAHNEDAALQLRKAIQLYFTGHKLTFILGVLADKDYDRILQITAPLANIIITITPDNNRALASTQLAIEAKKYCNGIVIDVGSVAKAVKLAYEEVGKEDVIIAFGSLSYLSEVKAALLSR